MGRLVFGAHLVTIEDGFVAVKLRPCFEVMFYSPLRLGILGEDANRNTCELLQSLWSLNMGPWDHGYRWPNSKTWWFIPIAASDFKKKNYIQWPTLSGSISFNFTLASRAPGGDATPLRSAWWRRCASTIWDSRALDANAWVAKTWRGDWPGGAMELQAVYDTIGMIWVVVYLPLWKILLGVLSPTYGKIENVPNHQPVMYQCSIIHNVWRHSGGQDLL